MRPETRLHFDSEPFTHDIEIAGLYLVVQSDAPDFDLWAQVLMVLLDGSAVKLGEDIRRARFPNSYFKNELMKPAQVVEISFDFYWMAQDSGGSPVARHHRSLQFTQPTYQKNYDTGDRIGNERLEDARIANNKNLHVEERRSCLRLALAASSTKPASH